MEFVYKFPVEKGIQAEKVYYIAMVPLKMLAKLFPGEDEYVPPEFRAQRRLNESGLYLEGSYKQLHHGPYKKEVREGWLCELLGIQKEINENGLEESANLELITIPELRNIRRIWVLDKNEFDDSLPRIYQELTGKKFDDLEWITLEIFKSEEWNILREVVEELYPDEELAFEMVYSLIDIENHSYSLNQRKGKSDSLERCIQRTFYKNEDMQQNSV